MGGAVHLAMAVGGLLAAAVLAVAVPRETTARRWTFRHTTAAPADLGMWSPARDTWRVVPFEDGVGGRALASDGGVLLVESSPVADVRVTTRCRAAAACGVVLAWSEGGFVTVAVDGGGTASVTHVRGDARTLLATADVARAGAWRDVAGEVREGRVHVRVDDAPVLDVAMPVRAGLVGLFADGRSYYDELTFSAAQP